VTNALAYCGAKLIVAVKRFILAGEDIRQTVIASFETLSGLLK